MKKEEMEACTGRKVLVAALSVALGITLSLSTFGIKEIFADNGNEDLDGETVTDVSEDIPKVTEDICEDCLHDHVVDVVNEGNAIEITEGVEGDIADTTDVLDIFDDWIANENVTEEEQELIDLGFVKYGDSFYYRGEDGVYCVGWKEINQENYYFDDNYKMVSGWQVIDNKTYFFGLLGKQKKGLKEIDGKLYFFDKKSGELSSGWKKVDDSYYYFDKDKNCKALKGKVKLKNRTYLFDEDCKLVLGLHKEKGETYYSCEKGSIGVGLGSYATGWVKLGKEYYYFNPKNGKMVKNAIVDGYTINKKGTSDTKAKIMRLVNKHTDSSMSVDEKIEACFNWICDNDWVYIRTYEHVDKDWVWYDNWQEDFANDLIDDKGGNCFRYASVFAYMAKEVSGYKARVYHGNVPASNGSGYKCPHGWVTLKIKGTWYLFDPDLNKFSSREDKSLFYYTEYTESKGDYYLDGEYVEL